MSKRAKYIQLLLLIALILAALWIALQNWHDALPQDASEDGAISE